MLVNIDITCTWIVASVHEYYSKVKFCMQQKKPHTNNKNAKRSVVNTEKTRGLVNMSAILSAVGTY